MKGFRGWKVKIPMAEGIFTIVMGNSEEYFVFPHSVLPPLR